MSKLSIYILAMLMGASSSLAVPALAKVKYDLEELATSETMKYDGPKEKIIAHFEARIKSNPKDWQAYLALGEYYIGKPDFRTLIEDAEQALNYYTKSLEIKPTELALFHRGEAYWILNQHEEALQDHLKSTELWPEDPMTWRHLAQTYEKMGDWKAMIKTYEKTIDILNQDKSKEFYALRYSTNSAGIEKYINGDKMIYLGKISDGHEKLGDYGKAIDYMSKVIEMLPTFFHWYNFRAELYEKTNQPEKALHDYKKAMSLMEDNSFKEHYLDKIKGLEKLSQ